MEADENDESQGTRELPGENHRPSNSRSTSFAAALRQQFRELVKALTQPTSSPKAQTKSRSTGETGRAFRLAAPRMTRRISVQSVMSQVADFAWDTLNWLHLWDDNDRMHTTVCGDDFIQSSDDHLSLHL